MLCSYIFLYGFLKPGLFKKWGLLTYPSFLKNAKGQLVFLLKAWRLCVPDRLAGVGQKIIESQVKANIFTNETVIYNNKKVEVS